MKKALLALVLWLSALPAGAEPRPFLDLDDAVGAAAEEMRIGMRKTLFALALLMALPAGAQPRPFFDLDFEASRCSAPWIEDYVPVFERVWDGGTAHSGRQSLRIRYTGGATTAEEIGFSGLLQEFPLADVLGKRVRLGGWLRTEGIAVGSADLYMSAVGPDGRSIAYRGLRLPPRGTTPWTHYEVEMNVPAETQDVVFGLRLAGNGTAWFDGLTIEIDGVPLDEGPIPTDPQLTPQAVSWLRRQAILFKTVRAGNGFADLQRLKPVIGNARIVALGEQTHGTREFFQMKHRLVEFLATEMGFTHFAIEANMPEAYRVNRYVLTGEGDPRELLRGMYYWSWNTQEVLDMILWMRDFNRSGKGRLQFLGFDMQVPGVAADIVRDFLGRAEPEYLREADPALARVEDAYGSRRSATAQEVAAVRAVFEHLQGGRDGYLARFAREEVDWAIQNARVALQAAENLVRPLDTRDKAMAANIEWILEQEPPGSKIVLWAHNGHVRKKPSWMGSYLAERFGSEMVVLGFGFAEGRYNAEGEQGLGAYPIGPPPQGTIEAYLRATRLPRFIVDLRRVPGGAPAAWFKQPRNFKTLGLNVVECPFERTVAGSEYDALIWIERTNPSALLPMDE